VSDCNLKDYISDKGESSEEMDQDLKSHVENCEKCRLVYVQKIEENNRLRLFLAKSF
jgi:hypothetical protein